MEQRHRPVRTLFVHTPTEPPLGADVWVHTQIMRWLDRDQHRVHLALAPCTPARPTPLVLEIGDITDLERVEVDPGPVMPARRSVGAALTLTRETLRWVRSLVALARYVRRNQIDVLHTCDRPRDAVLTVLIGRVCRVPSIVHVHVPHGPWMSRARTWGIASADHRIAVSEWVRELLIEAGCDGETTYTVLNALDPKRLVPDPRADDVRRDLGIPPDEVMVLSVCRLFEAKGALELVDAFAAADVPGTRLVIAGEDGSREQEYKRRLEARIADLGLGGRVVLTGWRDDIPALMTASDVFAMPSTGEPFGLVYLEAMAMGLPVIGLDHGGTPEVVTDEEEGLLSPLGDAPALAANLNRLLADEELRRTIGERGRRKAQRMTTPHQAREVADVYRFKVLPSPVEHSLYVEPMTPLTESGAASVVADVERDGYAVLRGVVPRDAFTRLDDLVTEVRTEYEGIVERGELFTAGGTISGHLNCHPGRSSRFVLDILREQGLLEVVRRHDPDTLDRVRVAMNYNLPHSHDQHFHPDGLYVEQFLIMNIAVTDITPENGPTQVIPGSHREFHKFWQYSRDRMYRQAIPVYLDKGDVLLRLSTMWHRGTSNHTDAVRPMMSVTFGEASAPLGDPFDSAIRFQPNWYGTTRADEIRERLFTTVPALYSTLRFGRSLVGNKGYSSW